MKRAMTISVLILLVLAAAVGCGDSGGANKETGEGVTQKGESSATAPPVATAPASTPASTTPKGQQMTGGEPVKSLNDFPNDQDGANVEAVIKTDKGDVTMVFYPDVAPVHVASFLNLARSGFYNGLKFHRVEPGFVVQGGDPLGNGTGGPGYRLPAEFSNRKHEKGTLAMARSNDPNSAGSQFYICLEPQPSLDGNYTVFGQVMKGMEVVEQIVPGDVIKEVVIQPKTSG